MNKKVVIFILSLIFLIQAVQLVIWIKKDDHPPAWDQSAHAMISLNFYNQIFGKSRLTTKQVEEIYPTFAFSSNYYPPLYHLAIVPFYVFFGVNYDSALLTNILFLLIFIVSVYFIGKKLHSPEAGLLMAFMISTIPTYSQFMRHCLVDFALSSMIALGLVLFFFTNNFQKLKYSTLLGIVFGLGMLVKWSYPVYLAIPIYYFYLFPERKLKVKSIIRLRNIFIAFFLFLITSAIWYATRIKTVFTLVVNFGFMQGKLENDPLFPSLKALSHYLFVILNQYSLIYLAIFFIAIIVLICSCKQKKKWLVYLISILMIYGIFTVLSNKDGRYILPIHVFLTIITVLGVFTVKSKTIKYGLIGFIVVFGLIQNNFYIARIMPPRQTPEININKILFVINGSSQSKPFSVCIISEAEALNDVNIPYYSFKNKYSVDYMTGNGCDPREFDYAIAGPIEKTWRSKRFEQSKAILENNKKDFKLIYSNWGVDVYKHL